MKTLTAEQLNDAVFGEDVVFTATRKTRENGNRGEDPKVYSFDRKTDDDGKERGYEFPQVTNTFKINLEGVTVPQLANEALAGIVIKEQSILRTKGTANMQKNPEITVNLKERLESRTTRKSDVEKVGTIVSKTDNVEQLKAMQEAINAKLKAAAAK